MSLKTFSSSFTVTPAASATDIFEFAPGTSKVYRIQKIILSGIQTTGSNVLFNLLRRITGATAGTSTDAPILYRGDLNGSNETAECRIRVYTVNPTVGTLDGTIRILRLPIPAASSPMNGIVEIDFGTEGLILQGDNYLCGNLGGVTLAGGSISVNIEFNEN